MKEIDLEISFLEKNGISISDKHLISLRNGMYDEIVSEQFRKFFISYSKSINKQYNRSGSLFQKNFKRKRIITDQYFVAVISYIHRNPKNHKIYEDFQNYPYSSYQRLLLDKPTKLQKEKVFEWFGNKENFIDNHNQVKFSIYRRFYY